MALAAVAEVLAVAAAAVAAAALFPAIQGMPVLNNK